MKDIDDVIFNDILTIIKDNLELLINIKNNNVSKIVDYCNNHNLRDLLISQESITQLTEEVLLALLNASFLYNFIEIE